MTREQTSKPHYSVAGGPPATLAEIIRDNEGQISAEEIEAIACLDVGETCYIETTPVTRIPGLRFQRAHDVARQERALSDLVSRMRAKQSARAWGFE